MRKLSIKWTDEANQEYICTLNRLKRMYGALKVHVKIKEKVNEVVKILSSFPFSGAVFMEIEEMEIRKIVVTSNYSIFYKVLDEEIIIVSFWNNKQDLSNLTFE